jgi:hypothetical protein
MVVFAIADFFIAWAQGAPILRVFALVAAVLVWLIGRALRTLLTLVISGATVIAAHGLTVPKRHAEPGSIAHRSGPMGAGLARDSF